MVPTWLYEGETMALLEVSITMKPTMRTRIKLTVLRIALAIANRIHDSIIGDSKAFKQAK